MVTSVWFRYDAAANAVGESAAGLVTLAERGDERAVFADYGVTLPIAAGAGGAPELLAARPFRHAR